MKYETISDATHAWVAEFSRFPNSMIGLLMEFEFEAWEEVTALAAGDRVYVFEPPEGSDEHYGSIESCDDETELYCIELDDGSVVMVDEDGFAPERDGNLPMWGTLWQFGDPCDDWWLEEQDGIRLMSECGFRVYKHCEWGYFFGIDGAGYDFYEAHWIPLYKARGLRWAKEQSFEEEEL